MHSLKQWNRLEIFWIISLLGFGTISLLSLSPQFIIHVYRQSQTALTAFYIGKDGFHFAYLTPIMGAPWTVPMEFPIFQIFTAIFHKLTPIGLVQSGKLINICCHILNNFILFKIVSRHKLFLNEALLGLIFYNLFPYYLVFDSVFLIDTFSLTLCCISFYFLDKIFYHGPSISSFGLFGMFSLLTALSKATVFLGTLVPAFLIITFFQLDFQSWKSIKFWRKEAKFILIVSGLMMFSLIGLLIWINFSDSVKMGNPLSEDWTSERLREWNYGTIEQRLSIKNWGKYFSYTMLSNPLINVIMLVVGVLFFIYSEKKERVLFICLLICLFTAPLLFFNLYIVHTYYSISSFIFLYFLLSTIIVTLAKKNKILSTFSICLALVLLCFGSYRSYVFGNQILKQDPEPGAYKYLADLQFNPSQNSVITVIHSSRDPYMEFFFKCRGINLSMDEYLRYGKSDKMKKLCGGLPVQMICLVDSVRLESIPKQFEGILKVVEKHQSISDYPESNNFYNFFWY